MSSKVKQMLDYLAMSSGRSGEGPTVRSEDRGLVVGVLERLLIDPDAVCFHEAQVLQVIQASSHRKPLNVQDHQAVLIGEWDKLDDSALGSLFLDPAAMRMLNREILDTLPDYWRAVIDRECESGFDELKAMEYLGLTPTARVDSASVSGKTVMRCQYSGGSGESNTALDSSHAGVRPASVEDRQAPSDSAPNRKLAAQTGAEATVSPASTPDLSSAGRNASIPWNRRVRAALAEIIPIVLNSQPAFSPSGPEFDLRALADELARWVVEPESTSSDQLPVEDLRDEGDTPPCLRDQLQRRLQLSDDVWEYAERLATKIHFEDRKKIPRDRLLGYLDVRGSADIRAVAHLSRTFADEYRRDSLAGFANRTKLLVKTMGEWARRDGSVALLIHLACDLAYHEEFLQTAGLSVWIPLYREAWLDINAYIQAPKTTLRRVESTDEHHRTIAYTMEGNTEAALQQVGRHLFAATGRHLGQYASRLILRWTELAGDFATVGRLNLVSGPDYFAALGHDSMFWLLAPWGEVPVEWKNADEYAEAIAQSMCANARLFYIGAFSESALALFHLFKSKLAAAYDRMSTRQPEDATTRLQGQQAVERCIHCTAVPFTGEECKGLHPTNAVFWHRMENTETLTVRSLEQGGRVSEVIRRISEADPVRTLFYTCLLKKLEHLDIGDPPLARAWRDLYDAVRDLLGHKDQRPGDEVVKDIVLASSPPDASE